MSSDPDIAARKRAGIQARYDRPGERARHAARMSALSRKLWSDPGQAEKWREKAKRLAHRTVKSEKCIEASRQPEVRARAAASKRETDLGWCPTERREEYRTLVNDCRIKAVEARRMIEETIPGTLAHARRQIANERVKARLRVEREKAQAY